MGDPSTGSRTSSLAESLAARARAASDGRLVLDVLAGMGAALGISVWRPIGWIGLTGVAIARAAFGLWGIIDRELSDRMSAGPAPIVWLLTVARGSAAVLGFACAIGASFVGLGVVLGTWIS